MSRVEAGIDSQPWTRAAEFACRWRSQRSQGPDLPRIWYSTICFHGPGSIAIPVPDAAGHLSSLPFALLLLCPSPPHFVLPIVRSPQSPVLSNISSMIVNISLKDVSNDHNVPSKIFSTRHHQSARLKSMRKIWSITWKYWRGLGENNPTVYSEINVDITFWVRSIQYFWKVSFTIVLTEATVYDQTKSISILTV